MTEAQKLVHPKYNVKITPKGWTGIRNKLRIVGGIAAGISVLDLGLSGHQILNGKGDIYDYAVPVVILAAGIITSTVSYSNVSTITKLLRNGNIK